MQALVTAAHGNRSLIVLTAHVVSKPAAAQLFRSPVNVKPLQQAALSLAALTVRCSMYLLTLTLRH
jgi:hypothetical protein